MFVDPFDINQITDALIKLVANPQLARKLGRQGRQRVERELNWERIVQRIKKIIKSQEKWMNELNTRKRTILQYTFAIPKRKLKECGFSIIEEKGLKYNTFPDFWYRLERILSKTFKCRIFIVTRVEK